MNARFILDKFTAVGYRLLDVIRLLPHRLLRLAQHLWLGLHWQHHAQSAPDREEVHLAFAFRSLAWWGECLIYLLECVGIGEVYETLMDLAQIQYPASEPPGRAIGQKYFWGQPPLQKSTGG